MYKNHKNENVCCTQHGFGRRGVLIGSITKLGNRLGGILVGRNLNRSSALPIVTTEVVGTP